MKRWIVMHESEFGGMEYCGVFSEWDDAVEKEKSLFTDYLKEELSDDEVRDVFDDKSDYGFFNEEAGYCAGYLDDNNFHHWEVFEIEV